MSEPIELEFGSTPETVNAGGHEIRADLALETDRPLFRQAYGPRLVDDVVVTVEQKTLALTARVGDVGLCNRPRRSERISKLCRGRAAADSLRSDPAVGVGVAH